MTRINPMRKVYGILNDPATPEKGLAFPVCLELELTNRCNLHCLFCPTGTGTMGL